MRTNRTLQLRREVLSELTNDDLRLLGGGEQWTGGGICRTIAALTIIVVPVSTATLCVCGDDVNA